MTVPNWRIKKKEKLDYITTDGVVYNLDSAGNRMLVNMSGWGMPSSPAFSTTSGPYQHGQTVNNIREGPRVVSLTQHVKTGCRAEYWSERSDLIDALRRNRVSTNSPSPGNLRWYLSNGNIRQLDVQLTNGPIFGRLPNNPTAFTEVLEFIAHNPIIYDPTSVSVSETDWLCSAGNELQFPIQFDSDEIVFTADACTKTNTMTVNYSGTWEEYPTITILGPANNTTIDHNQTGYRLQLNYDIGAGETVTFNLQYGVKEVTSDTSGGISLLGYISDDSDLSVFAIQPNPITTNGVNTFNVTIDDGDANTTVTMTYFNRYIGI